MALLRDIDACAALLRAVYDELRRSLDPDGARLAVDRLRRVCRAWREAVARLFAVDDASLSRGVVADEMEFDAPAPLLLAAWREVARLVPWALAVDARSVREAWLLVRDRLMRRATAVRRLRLRFRLGARLAVVFWVDSSDREEGSAMVIKPDRSWLYAIRRNPPVQLVRESYVSGAQIWRPRPENEGFFARDLRIWAGEY